MATTYTVKIQMSTDSVVQLTDNGFHLYAFKGVATSAAGGEPLVWFDTRTFSTITNLIWETQYEAYTSKSEIIPNGYIEASFNAGIDLDQTLKVTSTSGVGEVVAGGNPGAISILNQTSEPFTCGISQLVDNESNSLCAFPLFGNGLDVMAPIEKVLLMFATQTVNTGTVLEKSFSTSFFIDMTGAPQQTRAVNFDINLGWSCSGCVWANQFPPNSNLSPILIESSANAVQQLLAA